MGKKHLNGKWGNRRAGGPPPNEGYLWHTLDLLRSPAWRTRPIYCIRLIEFLEIEHLKHGGVCNGDLVAPYLQLEQFGIGRRLIPEAIKAGEDRGLIKVRHGDLKGRTVSHLSRYRLTYCWTRPLTGDGRLYDWQLPTDDWKAYEPRRDGSLS